MGKLLISGNGKGHRQIYSWWIQFIIGGAISAAICYYFANDIGIDAGSKGVTTFGRTYGAREASKNEMWYVFMALAALSPVFMLVMGAMSHRMISKTAIDVYENGINGTGSAGEWLQSLFSFQMKEFSLTYNQISSVDIEKGNQLIINVANTKHKIYAMNAREIRDAIMAQKSKVG